MDGQEFIINDKWEEKLCLRQEAEDSVVAAFAQMGVHLKSKQAEKIDKIIEMHDPAIVKSAIQKLQEHPTWNMEALADSRSVKNLKTKKNFILGGVILLALGFAGFGLALVSPAAFPSIFFAGSGAQLLTQVILDTKEDSKLIPGCIEDLLNEVEKQGSPDKAIAKEGAK